MKDWPEHYEPTIADLERAAPGGCRTCDGTGIVGEPPMRPWDLGEEPCPDCGPTGCVRCGEPTTERDIAEAADGVVHQTCMREGRR